MKAVRLAGLLIASALLLLPQSRQSRRSYGPDRVWWDADQSGTLPPVEDYDDAEGTLGILNRGGAVNTANHGFFTALGTNGRACVTCHQPSNAMSISVETIRAQWDATDGQDPLFAAFDGSDCPNLPQAKASSHSLLLARGLIRIPMAWPPKDVVPEFRLEVVKDPTGCNVDSKTVSVYRRPRQAANFAHLTSGADGTPTAIRLMADGREASLRTQALSAIFGHEEAQRAPSAEQLAQILEFERGIAVAQSSDLRGGLLTDPTGPAFLGPARVAGKIAAIALWADPAGPEMSKFQREFRESVARGSRVFFQGERSCGSCHKEARATVAISEVAMDIGTANLASPKDGGMLPVFKATCTDGRVVYTQDPGRALVTGKCADIGAIVMQQLRGLAARAPYFSNGSARTLEDVVEFYQKRYAMGYTAAERADLVNFLKTL
jgi:cytochrome c peroxidase